MKEWGQVLNYQVFKKLIIQDLTPKRRKGTFVPKGKRRAMTIYRLRWKRYPSLIDGIKEGGLVGFIWGSLSFRIRPF